MVFVRAARELAIDLFLLSSKGLLVNKNLLGKMTLRLVPKVFVAKGLGYDLPEEEWGREAFFEEKCLECEKKMGRLARGELKNKLFGLEVDGC